jgi:drug/metabolite transporter (DMT)-like permease
MSWFWLALIAAALWGLGYTLNQATLKYFNPYELLFFESVIIFAAFTLYFWAYGDFKHFLSKLGSWKLLSMISASSIIYIIASSLILISIKSSNASLAAIIESSYPLFTVIFAFIFLGEIQLSWSAIIGFILVLTGIIIIKINN